MGKAEVKTTHDITGARNAWQERNIFRNSCLTQSIGQSWRDDEFRASSYRAIQSRQVYDCSSANDCARDSLHLGNRVQGRCGAQRNLKHWQPACDKRLGDGPRVNRILNYQHRNNGRGSHYCLNGAHLVASLNMLLGISRRCTK
jgi:hypothetical protein